MAHGRDKQLIYKSIKRYIAALRKQDIDVVAAYLFGSFATGDPDAWSDIDVAILTNKFLGDSFDFRFLLMKIAGEIDPDIEPHPFLVDEFDETNPFAAQVLRTGERVA
jgi:predicted nucleotidyltransferase